LPVALQLSNSAGQNAKHLLVMSVFVVQNRMHEAYTWLQLPGGALIAEIGKPIVITIKATTNIVLNIICFASSRPHGHCKLLRVSEPRQDEDTIALAP
jgi:hypothetical protein